jgi:hypothetical protein
MVIFEISENENAKRCLTANEISEWARSTPFYPELAETKKDLLKLSDLLDEYVFQIMLHNNKDGNWRGDIENKITVQITKVKESILKVERDYNLKR